MKKFAFIVIAFSLLPCFLHAEIVNDNAQEASAHFPKQNHVMELKAFGGSYLGARLGQSWLAGANATYHLNPLLGFGASYSLSRAYPDSSSTFGSNLDSKAVHLLIANGQLSNDALFKVGKHWLPMDFFMTLGAGAMQIDRLWKPVGLVGGGVKFFTPKPWLAINVEVNNYLHHTPQPGKDHLDFDVAFVAGVSFFLPPLKHE